MLIKTDVQQLPDGYLDRTPMFQYILLSICFPMWGIAASLNDILITQFKSIFTLSDFASAFVQSAFYGGYFLLAIPASRVIRRWSYKLSILIGLSCYIGGCMLFFPVSHMATYSVFLVALFAIAVGLCRGTFFPGNVLQYLFVDDWPERQGDAASEYFANLLSDWLYFRYPSRQISDFY